MSFNICTCRIHAVQYIYIYHISVNSTLYDVVRVASSVWFANARRLKGKC